MKGYNINDRIFQIDLKHSVYNIMYIYKYSLNMLTKLLFIYYAFIFTFEL